MQKTGLYWTGSLLFILFLIFSLAVRLNLFNQFDYAATVWLQAHISRQLDTFFSIFSFLGTVDVTSVFLLIFIICYKNRNSLYIIGSYGIILCIELFNKYFINHPAPPGAFARYKVLLMYPSAYLPQPPSSYPSGHAGRTLFLSGILLFLLFRSKRYPKIVRWLLAGAIILYDVILLVSRVDLGEHWTSDVIGGSILGLALAFFNAGVIASHNGKAASVGRHGE